MTELVIISALGYEKGAASNVNEIQVVRSRFLPPLHLLRGWALGYGLR